jgi:hypothetical protein
VRIVSGSSVAYMQTAHVCATLSLHAGHVVGRPRMEDSSQKGNKLAQRLSWVAFILSAVWLLISWRWRIAHPPVGTYIGILAFAAAVMTLWPPPNRWSRAAWIMVCGVLLVLEITTLYRQRSEDDSAAEIARKTEDERFEKILKQNQKEFDATVDRFQSLSTQETTNLNNITGGNSFCYLRPSLDSKKGIVDFYVLQVGSYPVSDATMRFIDNDYVGETASPLNSRIAVQRAPLIIGTLSKNGVVRSPLIPPGQKWQLPQQKEKKFTVAFSARNGSWDQFVLIKRMASGEWFWPTRVVMNPGQTTYKRMRRPWRVIYQFKEPGLTSVITEKDWDSFSGQSVWCRDCN